MFSWGGHRANGEGGLRPSSNAELSIFGQSLELFSPGLPATSTLHPWPQHTRSYWRETLASDTQHIETFERLPIAGVIDLDHARKKFGPTWPDPIVIKE